MKYWKKMALVLALVAGLFGGAWAQDGGKHDRDKPRDTHQWQRSDHDWKRDHDRDRDHDRYRDYDRYRDRDRDWRYRNYPRGYYPNGGYYSYYPDYPAWGYSGYGYGGYYGSDYQAGYNYGAEIGRYDRMYGRAYQPGNYKAFKNGDQAYRNGFAAGYQVGYGW